ncbi:MAG: flagellar hook assembly protein FlgD [Armatimonadota bacterium]|nr:flagellar hook assembly protein FlgD [Armatimonadota bacterium]MDR7439033.1 flagellar hook assembly protein FlgD [Armatimonadota bacterium]MDR7563593.1 flagellar hook assembly protein FlgD [Armatimonadota bacterium]MDR7566841.1 flagellar hook assembly protein FlgD [Armatimonadota bacterium]MDR7601198.1 flagellar hook assembly protein FlgD [Armatimonadota bacterium]
MEIRAVQQETGVRAGSGVLGKDDFLRLLVTQLRNQDPLEPMNDREFIAQLAQFSALEQMHNVSQAVQELRWRQEASTAVQLVGRRVVVQNADGTTAEGMVMGVRRREDRFVLLVGGEEYTLDQLVEVTG